MTEFSYNVRDSDLNPGKYSQQLANKQANK